MPKNVSRWVILAVVYLYAVAIHLPLQAIPPVLSLIMEDLHISHAQVGLLMAMYALPAIFLVIPLSFILTRYGIKLLGIGFLSVVIIGSIVTLVSNSFELLILGRLLIGIGAVAISIVVLPAITQWFIGNRLGLAMSLFSTTLPLAIIISLNTFGIAGITWGWRSAILITIIVAIVALFLFAVFFRERSVKPESGEEARALKLDSLFKIGWPIWVLAISWGLFNLIMSSVTTFSPDYMYQSGIELGTAGTITSMIFVVGIFIIPFIGHLLDKTRYKEIFCIIGAIVCGAATYLLTGDIKYILFFIITVGIFTIPFAPTTFSLTPSLVKPRMTLLAFGIITTFNYVGMFVGPSFTGLILDITGSYPYAYRVIALFFLLIVLLLAALLIRRVKKAQV